MERQAAETAGPKRGGMKLRWVLLGAAAVFAAAAWAALGVGYVLRPSLAVWAGLVGLAALSLEVLFWTAAGVFGWSFLAKRRASLARLRQRLFGRRADSSQ
ncbi:MAG: hypothetical protein BroJett013_34810 [Alphaproteobacteria bacterium]|nr:MAG: hypothetical protein BroJett013_34810 [Alphaproteobacteria bacterium]